MKKIKNLKDSSTFKILIDRLNKRQEIKFFIEVIIVIKNLRKLYKKKFFLIISNFKIKKIYETKFNVLKIIQNKKFTKKLRKK